MTNNDFEKFLTIKKGLQPITIHGYLGAIRRFKAVVDSQEPTIQQAEDYIFEFYRSNYSYTYKMNTAVAIEMWFGFREMPIKFGRQKKPCTIIKNVLTEAEVTKLIFNCRNIRETAIVSLLAYSGIRCKEICNLRVKDLDLGQNIVRVVEGKGSKDRLVYMSSECTRIILKYLTEYPRKEESYLFTTLKENNKYGGQDLRKLLKKLGLRTKIEKRIYPYLLRHTLATNMLNRGANLLTIKNQLGHIFIESTMVYIHSVGYGVKNDYDRFAPSYL